MSPRTILIAPRLADHVAARRHVIGGEVVVALHDERRGGVATIGEREWTLLRKADGTRGLDGIVSAARRAGQRVSRDNLEAFFEQLEAAGMISHGPSLPPDEERIEAGSELPVRAMPGFSLRCDGAGTCCRLYPTTLFSALEARTALHHDADPARRDERFTPERGGEHVPWRAGSVTMVDGRCAYLEVDGRCRLHVRAGAAAKPKGCRQYPLQLVSDGREVRAAVAPECACVFDSADGGGGDPLIDPWPRHAGELEPTAFVAEVPGEVRVAGEVTMARERFVAWSDARAAAFELARGDPARWLWAEADALVASQDAARPGAPVDLAVVEAMQRRLAKRLDRRATMAAWRSGGDLARALPRWLGRALDVGSERLVAPREGTQEERFFVRALMFAHDPALTGDDVAGALRRRALQLWSARRLAEVLAAEPGDRDPAWRRPLALVAAHARAFGL